MAPRTCISPHSAHLRGPTLVPELRRRRTCALRAVSLSLVLPSLFYRATALLVTHSHFIT